MLHSSTAEVVFAGGRSTSNPGARVIECPRRGARSQLSNLGYRFPLRWLRADTPPQELPALPSIGNENALRRR